MISELERSRAFAADISGSGRGDSCATSASTRLHLTGNSNSNRWAPTKVSLKRPGGGQESLLPAKRDETMEKTSTKTTELKTTCLAKISRFLVKKRNSSVKENEPFKMLNSAYICRESEKNLLIYTKTATRTIMKIKNKLMNSIRSNRISKSVNWRQFVKMDNTSHRQQTDSIDGSESWRKAANFTNGRLLFVSLAIIFLLCATLQQPATGERLSAHHHRPTIDSTSVDSSAERSQFGDLVAIGAISLVEPAAHNPLNQSGANNGRLTNETPPNDTQRTNKLDYIVDFMRTNKLTKFCDLLTSQEPEIRALNERLDMLGHFTLFVPTNEALLLMPSGQFEQIKSGPAETKKFLLAHLTSELVVPRLSGSTAAIQQAVVPAASTSTVLSLSGNQMRVSTVPIQTHATKHNQQHQGLAANQTVVPQLAPLISDPAPVRSIKLELIVNGANVVSGHSYALQEPNNSSVTYAIVHLIDRALYPVPTQSLMERVRSLAPRMAKYIEQAGDGQLNEWLESDLRLSTLFLPNDDAFRGTSSKLLNYLDTNQTFLVEFLRAHLVEGLYYSNQLASSPNNNNNNNNNNGANHPDLNGNQPTSNKLIALSKAPLEFESKTLQSRTLVLVNSIPILGSDLMATNGVVHLITRPIFERHLLEECRCGSEPLPTSTGRYPANLTELAIYEKLWPGSRSEPASASRHNVIFDSNLLAAPSRRSNLNNWFPSTRAPEIAATGNELEREESQPQRSTMMSNEQQVRARSSRSGLVTRNNRDFYRPSAAPANLLMGSAASNPQQQQQQQQQQSIINLSETQRQDTSGQIFMDKNQLNRILANNNETRAKILVGSRLQEEASLATTEASLKRVPTSTMPSAVSRWIENTPPSNVKDLFEVERYKVVLNATSRQRMRSSEQQRDPPAASTNQFVYDRPLLSSTNAPPPLGQQGLAATVEPYSSSKRPYLEATTPNVSRSSNVTSWASNVDQLSLAASRQQRVLKFQPEDARDSPPGTRIHSNNNNSQLGGLPSSQPVYDVFGSPRNATDRLATGNKQLQQANMAKTVAPASFACAFYDTECKRVVGRLVHLPAFRQSARTKAPQSFQASASNQTVRTSSLPAEQHLDSTFGEATESPSLSTWSQTQSTFQLAPNPTGGPKQSLPASAFIRPSPPRISPLNQPLPPWSDEEHRVGQPNWRAQDSDIARIVNNKQLQAPSTGGKQGSPGFASFPVGSNDKFTGGISRENSAAKSASLTRPSPAQTNRQAQAQILLVPVKVMQDGSVAPMEQLSQFTRNKPTSPAPASNNVFFNNQQFHTPTPYSVSLITTHLPPMFNSNSNNNNNNNNNNSPLGRLTNFTAFETFPSDEQSLRANAKNLRIQQAELSQVPRAPSAHRKQRLQQIQIDNSGALGANFDLNPANGEKQARKIVRIQATPTGLGNPSDFFTGTGGDISITSARLSAPPSRAGNFTLAGGLATQASQPAPNVSSNFVRSVSEAEQQAAAAAANDPSADFFQNRTIAEIMDDSGLRIDGQQVTFARLKECLTEAELLNLVTQTGNSLTIFMPTDSAFQRLVQQQVIAQQRDRQQSSMQVGTALRSSVAGRLSDPTRRHLIPLVARRPNSAKLEEPSRLFGAFSESPLQSSDSGSDFSGASDRLTLDCSSSQVRQILLDHLSSRLVAPKQLQSDMGISSLSGRQLLLSSVPSKKIVVVDGQPVIAATRAKNGMVYVVNKFLNLTQQVPNVMDLIETQPNLTTFLSYLSFSSLANRLRRETGPLTVLAPTNEAFEQLSSAARQLINSDPSALTDILRGHVVEGAQFGKLISMRNRLKTMNTDQNIEAKVIKPNLYLLDNQMTSMRLVGTTGNGVVNAIDRLIVPAWLKVSMGAKLASDLSRPDGSNSSFTNRASGNSFNTGSSLFVGELEASTARTSGRTVGGNNLPLIGNRPLRFEQPAERLATPNNSGSSSFLFAKSDSRDGGSSAISNTNNLLDFDLPSPVTDNSISNFSSSTPTNRSPFLRVAANLTGNDVSSRPLSSNVTKNMQLIEKLAGLMKAKKFVKYLFRSRLSESLKPDMSYVILVPTDQAIEKLPKQIIDMLDRDPERLSDLVNYHILDTTFEYINTIPDGQTLNTLNEKDILFNWHRNNTILTASGAVVMGGIQEENIALLIVDRVLYPTPGDILNIISKSPILSNFTALVRNAGLEQQLSLAGPYTLFAPSDFAFNQLDRVDLEFLQRNRDTARRFLLRHLSQPAVFTSSIALSNSSQPAQVSRSTTGAAQATQVPTMTISNSLGEDLTLRQRNDYFSVNEVNFSYADVAATNGVVHVIDGLL